MCQSVKMLVWTVSYRSDAKKTNFELNVTKSRFVAALRFDPKYRAKIPV